MSEDFSFKISAIKNRDLREDAYKVKLKSLAKQIQTLEKIIKVQDDALDIAERGLIDTDLEMGKDYPMNWSIPDQTLKKINEARELVKRIKNEN